MMKIWLLWDAFLLLSFPPAGATDVLSEQVDRTCREIAHTAELLEFQGDFTEARSILASGLTLIEAAGEQPAAEAALRIRMASVHRAELEFEDALEELKRVESLARQSTDKRILGDYLFQMGYILDHRQMFERGGSEYDDSREYYEKSLALRRETGDWRGQAFSLFRIGRLSELQADDETASDYYRKALEIAEARGFPIAESYIVSHLGLVAERDGRFESARDHFERALQIQEANRLYINLPFTYIHLGRIQAKLFHEAEAEKLFQASLELSESRGLPRTVPFAYRSIGDLYLQQGRLEGAIGAFERSIERAESLGSRAWNAGAWMRLGKAVLEKHDFAHAAEVLSRTVAILTEGSHAEEIPYIRALLARAQVEIGNREPALDTLRELLSGSAPATATSVHLYLAAARLSYLIGEDERSSPAYASVLKTRGAEDFQILAVDSARDSHDQDLLALSLLSYAEYLHAKGGVDAAKEKLKDALAAAEAGGSRVRLDQARELSRLLEGG